MSDLLDSRKPVRVKGQHHSTGRTMAAAIMAHVQDRTDTAPGREQFLCPFVLCRSCNHHFGYRIWQEPQPETCGRCGSTKLINVQLSWNR
jgi:hypothetical protein